MAAVSHRASIESPVSHVTVPLNTLDTGYSFQVNVRSICVKQFFVLLAMLMVLECMGKVPSVNVSH